MTVEERWTSKMTSAPVERLREMAGPELYRRNAFRITGLPTDVTRRRLLDYQQRRKLAANLGRSAGAGGNGSSAEPERELAAIGTLLDNQSRLVHELLWTWDISGASCECVSSLHGDHDDAVSAHLLALDLELDGGDPVRRDRMWVLAAERWSALLRRAAFWGHMRHRIEVLDDRRIDESTVDDLRDALPRVLVAPLITLAIRAEDPSRLLAHAARWDVGDGVVERLVEEAVTPWLDEVNTLVNEAFELHEKRDRPSESGALLREKVVPLLDRIERYLPHQDNSRHTRVRNRAAVAVNNSALALGRLPSPPMAEVIELYTLANQLAVLPEDRETMAGNLEFWLGKRRAAASVSSSSPSTRPTSTHDRVPGRVPDWVFSMVGGLIALVVGGLIIGLPFLLSTFMGTAGWVVGVLVWVGFYFFDKLSD